MSRPQTQAEYLASLLPPSVAGTQFGRRALFRGALGVAAAGSLAACGNSGDTATDTKSATGVVTFGSNQSDAVPKAAYAKVTEAKMGSPEQAEAMKNFAHSEQADPLQAGLKGGDAVQGALATVAATSAKQGTPEEARGREVAVSLAAKVLSKL